VRSPEYRLSWVTKIDDAEATRSVAVGVSPADPAVARAVALSVFDGLPSDVLAGLLAGCRDASVGQGYRFMGADHPDPYRTGLVVSGLLRMYVQSPDGRQVNIRYAGPGYFLGAATTVSRRSRVLVPAGVQAVTAARVLYLNQEYLRSAACADAAVAWALLEQMVQYQWDLIHLLAGAVFGSIRQRTAMHLLSLAAARSDGALVAAVTQQELADAVGTTREVVARALGELRAAGALATVRGGVLLRDPERLAAEANSGAGV
jgi:CRP/FNR family cyclic AMP-dependent transcriptional regulator